MPDNIFEVGNFADEQIEYDKATRGQQAAALTGPIGAGNVTRGGGAGDPPAAPAAANKQMMEMMRLISQMTLSNQHAQQVMMQRQFASSATAADTAAASAATAAAALAKQTPEMSLNTPVLFWGITLSSTNGNWKGITPNSFLKELERRQTRQSWTDEDLLRYVQSCLRGEADLWWTGTLCTYDDLGAVGPTTNYAAFKLAFRQH
jgi:hypothetical protein